MMRRACALDGHLRRPRRRRRGADGEIAAHRARRRQRRLPAGARAPALDRHADRLSGLTVRAPRWVSMREIDATLPSAAPGSCARSTNGARGGATSCRANGRPAPRSSIADASLRSPCIRRASATIAADLLNLTVLHPPRAGRARRSPRSSRAGCAKRRSASCSPRVAEYAARVTPASPIVKLSNAPLRMGKLRSEGRDPPQLATDPAAARPRAATSSRTRSRTWSSSTIRRGSGRLVEALFPRSAARTAGARRLDGAARS